MPVSEEALEQLRAAATDTSCYKPPAFFHLPFGEWKRLRAAGMIDDEGRFVVRREAGGEEGA